MKSSVIVWDLETVPDLGGFAAANDIVGKSDVEVREAICHGETRSCQTARIINLFSWQIGQAPFSRQKSSLAAKIFDARQTALRPCRPS